MGGVAKINISPFLVDIALGKGFSLVWVPFWLHFGTQNFKKSLLWSFRKNMISQPRFWLLFGWFWLPKGLQKASKMTPKTWKNWSGRPSGYFLTALVPFWSISRWFVNESACFLKRFCFDFLISGNEKQLGIKWGIIQNCLLPPKLWISLTFKCGGMREASRIRRVPRAC